MIKHMMISMCVALLLSGCSWSFWPMSSAKSPSVELVEKTAVEKIVLSELDLDRPYDLVQDISVKVSSGVVPFSTPTKDAINAKLKEEASKLGANAVIYVRYQTIQSNWAGFGGGMEARGKAVKFKYY